MANPLIRLAIPFAIGALASAGAIVGATLVRERREQLSLGTPAVPLAYDGWWNSDQSSPLAYAHPAVLFVDAGSGTLLDSWDRRSRARVHSPVVSRRSEWPADGVIVVDAGSGDLLHVLQTAGMTPG